MAEALSAEAHFRNLATALDEFAEAGPLRLVGFSLGAAAALRVVPLLETRDLELHLIAPAAPLQLGDFLDRLAGHQVFKLAGRSPRLFRLLTALQGGMARVTPGALMKALFGSAQGDDRALAADPHFCAMLAEVLQASLGQGRAGYCREVEAFVQDWRAVLPQVTCPVHIWQGDADNWVVPDMAQALAGALPDCAPPTLLAGKSHYSALQAYLAENP
ncbi:MAG: alpha/beta hydrolase [Sphingomonadaceae bacterium]|nr:alpha/beta hydrolase [Sphingomonadaceae bacterium]